MLIFFFADLLGRLVTDSYGGYVTLLEQIHIDVENHHFS